jgi:hypothetical protein
MRQVILIPDETGGRRGNIKLTVDEFIGLL